MVLGMGMLCLMAGWELGSPPEWGMSPGREARSGAVPWPSWPVGCEASDVTGGLLALTG